MRELNRDPMLAVQFLREAKPFKFGTPPGLGVTFDAFGPSRIFGIPAANSTGRYLCGLGDQIMVIEVYAGRTNKVIG